MKYFPLLIIMFFSSLSFAQHEELGQVNWLRDYDTALKESEKSNKPVFILFQEVPGCATCRNYGHNVMSHPLIVEAIESLFVPLAIFNNKGGKDAAILKKYNEPSWNNPVVRIVDETGDNLVPRIARNYEKLAVAQAMIYALERQGKEVPTYLKLLEEELNSRNSGIETAHLSMYCFWSGERNIGDMQGVVETQAGFMNGAEVVRVSYDPQKTSLQTIVKNASQANCASQVFTDDPEKAKVAETILGKNKTQKEGNFRADKDPKYYLSRTFYRFVPMTQLQAARVNSQIAKGQNPDALLSPRQLTLLKKATSKDGKGFRNVVNEDIQDAWKF